MNKLIIFILISVLSFSCTNDFEEVNKNPNSPEAATPELMLVNILRTAATSNTSQAIGRGAGAAQYIAKYDYNSFDRFEWDSNSYYWETLFAMLRDINIMTELEQSNESYEAVGLIMRAWAAAQLTELWVNVPFYEGAKGKTEKIYSAQYDSQEEIYLGEGGVLNSLERANEILKTTEASLAGDIIFNGDLSKWRKFANSLRLRYMMRVSSQHSFTAEMQTIVDSEPIMTGNEDNAELKALAAMPNQSYTSMVRLGDFTLWSMTTKMEKVMTVLDDPRMPVLYAPGYIDDAGEPVYKGFPIGITDGREEELGVELSKLSGLNKEKFFEKKDDFQYVLMNCSEVSFIIAEAACKGLILGGDTKAEEYYNKGITASLEYYGAYDEDYLTAAGVLYDAAEAEQLIMTQKWLANFLVGYEGWLDFKRTGLPEMEPNLDNTNVVNGVAMIPSRFFYPADEQLNNKENYTKALSEMGGSDSINYRHWWEKSQQGN